MQDFGTYIKKQRQNKGFSIETFAKQIAAKPETIFAIEQNKKLPNKKQINLFAYFLNIDINQLMVYYYVDSWFKQIGDTSYAKEVIKELQNRLKAKELLSRNELIKRITDYVKNMPIEKAWIFGSLARNDMNIDSDIDILVRYIKHKKIDLFDFIGYIVDLENLTNRKIDLVEENFEAEFAKENIQKEKIEIYERKTKR